MKGRGQGEICIYPSKSINWNGGRNRAGKGKPEKQKVTAVWGCSETVAIDWVELSQSFFVPVAEEGSINVPRYFMQNLAWSEFSLLHSAIMGGDLVEFYWVAFYGGHTVVGE